MKIGANQLVQFAVENDNFSTTKDSYYTLEDYKNNPCIFLGNFSPVTSGTETKSDDNSKDSTKEGSGKNTTTCLWYALEKKMYAPTCFKTLFQVTLMSGNARITAEGIREIFIGRRVKVIIGHNSGTTTKNEIQPDMYITDVAATVMKSTTNDKTQSYEVLFTLHTPDIFLTLDKYCKAYTARQLASEIIPTEIGQTAAASDLKAELSSGEFAKSELKISLKQTSKLSELLGFEHNLKHLYADLTEKDTKGTPKKIEHIQPYLVQYNESFYDFICRAANRCGEFLFFEDAYATGAKTGTREPINGPGKLFMGLRDPGDEGNTINTLNYASYTKVGRHSSSHVGSIWHKNYDEPKNLDENAARGIDQYAPIVEWLKEVKKNEGDVGNELKYPSIWLKSITAAAQKRTLMEMVVAFGTDTALTSATIALKLNKYYEGKFNDKNIKDYKFTHKNYQVKGDEEVSQYSLLKDSPLMDSDAFPALNATFYENVHEYGLKAEEGRLIVDLGSNFTKLVLGMYVKFPDGRNQESKEANSGSSSNTNTQAGGGSTTNTGEDLYVITRISRRVDDMDAINGIKVDSSKEEMNCKSHTEIELLPLIKDAKGNYKAYPVPMEEPARKSAPQTAFVADVKDPFAMGRVRIRYPWQKAADQASPWVRVSMPMASDGAGFDFKPLEGDEVLLNYENGDIDRPYVAGYLYNGSKKFSTFDANYNVPNTSTRSIMSANGHTIIFRDPGTNAALMNVISPGLGFLNGMFGFAPETKSSFTKRCNGGIELRDSNGFYSINMSSDSRSINISSTLGNVSLNAFTGITISAPNGNISIKGKNVSIEAGNQVSIKSGTNITPKTNDTVKSILGYKSFTSFNRAATQVAGGIISKFFDFSLLRTMVEALLKPVGGTMVIKSNRYLQLAAGKGTIEKPAEDYGELKLSAHPDDDKFKDLTRQFSSEALLIGIKYAIKLVDDAYKSSLSIGKAVEECTRKYDVLHNLMITTYQNQDQDIANDLEKIKYTNAGGNDNLYDKIWDEAGTYNLESYDLLETRVSLAFGRAYNTYFSNNQNGRANAENENAVNVTAEQKAAVKAAKDEYVRSLWDVVTAIANAKKTAGDQKGTGSIFTINNNIKKLFKNVSDKVDNVKNSPAFTQTLKSSDYKNVMSHIITASETGISNVNDTVSEKFTKDILMQKANNNPAITNCKSDVILNLGTAEFKRQAVYSFLNAISTGDNKYIDLSIKAEQNAEDKIGFWRWRGIAYGIYFTEPKHHIEDSTILSGIQAGVSIASDIITNPVKNLIKEGKDFHEQAIWSPKQEGEITFSIKAGKTLHINNGGTFEAITTQTSYSDNLEKIRSTMLSVKSS